MPAPNPEYARRIKDARVGGMTQREAAKNLKIPRTTIQGYWGKEDEVLGAAAERANTRLPTPERTFRDAGDGTATAEATSFKPIKTEEDAIRAAEVDTSVWYVHHFETSAWTVPMKVEQGQEPNGLWKAARPIQTQQYGVKLWLRRLQPKSHKAALDAIWERMKHDAPAFPKFPKLKPKGEPHLAVMGLVDAHFGKLAWAPEVGRDYDLKIAERLYANAVDDLIARTAAIELGLILLPIGSDFFHMDNSRNTTHNGTPQDVDGRYAKVIEAGEMAVINAVKALMPIAPVKLVWVPGNHDPTTSYHLARTVWAYFHRSDRVEVDAAPSPRKYVAWGTNLIGLTHGNEEKPEELPSLMAADEPQKHAAATCRHWLIGHRHRSQRWVTKETDTFHGTEVRTCRALTGTDAWHHRKGFVGAAQAAEVFFYGRDTGYAGHAVAYARVG